MSDVMGARNRVGWVDSFENPGLMGISGTCVVGEHIEGTGEPGGSVL